MIYVAAFILGMIANAFGGVLVEKAYKRFTRS
jgi:hypothetical protein